MSRLDEMIAHRAEVKYNELIRKVESDAISKIHSNLYNPVGVEVKVIVPESIKAQYIENYKESFYISLIYNILPEMD